MYTAIATLPAETIAGARWRLGYDVYNKKTARKYHSGTV